MKLIFSWLIANIPYSFIKQTDCVGCGAVVVVYSITTLSNWVLQSFFVQFCFTLLSSIYCTKSIIVKNK